MDEQNFGWNCRHCFYRDEPGCTEYNCYYGAEKKRLTKMQEVRLIDANALIKNICDECVDEGTHCDQTDCLRYTERNRIESAPTVESKPVRHGRWIFVGEETSQDGWTHRKYKCSECEFQTVEAVNFCQKCGADMRDGGGSNGG